MHNKHVYAVILAGGAGTRFWPVSRKSKPKQFLEIVQKETLLDLTIKRIKILVPSGNIFIVTNEQYRKETKKCLKSFRIPPRNMLLEPSAKNTAPAICWAAAKIHSRDPKAITICLPSDHLILNKIKYFNVMKQAITLAKRGLLVTFGIVPTRPETGYGYLQTVKKKVNGKSYLSVAKFTEKPNKTKAKIFVKKGNYLWNSGMFVWRTETILDEFKVYLPKIYNAVGVNPVYLNVIKKWKSLPKISVDYGILEKSKKVAALKAGDLGWSDLGSWESLYEALSKNKKGNIFIGDTLDMDVKDSLVYGDKRKIALIGLENCIVVDTKDALLVCKKEDSQQVKEVVDMLTKKRSKLV